MKKFLIALMLAMPMAMSAQDNTWERIEQDPVEKSNPNAKYLAKDAVPPSRLPASRQTRSTTFCWLS